MFKKYDFNVSHSAISTYDTCQRTFYYQYILKMIQIDVPDAYADAGIIVHFILETTHDKSIEESLKIFNNMWESKKLHTTNRGVYNSLLKKDDYWNAVLNGKDKKYNILKREEKFEIQDDYLLKGFVDVKATTENIEFNNKEIEIINKNKLLYSDKIIVDWKTNSRFKKEHYNQMYFYAYLYYRKHGKLPKKFIWEYLKIDKTRSKIVTMNDIVNVNEKIKNFIKEIHLKKNFSDWIPSKKGIETKGNCSDCFFCGYKKLCQESGIDSKEEHFNLILKHGRIHFNNQTTQMFDKIIDKYFSYSASNDKKILARIIKAVKIKSGNDWDGIYHMKNYDNSYPIGLLNKMIFYINLYAEATKKYCPITITDQRKKFSETSQLRDKLIGIDLYYYQKEAVDLALYEKISIISVPTSGGKTIIASEIYRRKPTTTLFVVDVKILFNQSIREFEEVLGMKGQIGTITKGEINLKSNLTVATIQTINSRLKIDKIDSKEDYTEDELNKLKKKIEIQKIKNKEMREYLNNVEMVITDECHLNKSKSYDNLFNNAVNSKYRIGLSGTPNIKAIDALKLHKNLGYVVYKIPIQTLIGDGTIMKPRIEFLSYDIGSILEGNYNDVQEQLFEHENRNSQIIDICVKNIGKITMLLVDRISHGNLLKEMLDFEKIDSFFIQGSVSDRLREKILKDARNGHTRVLIGTSQIVSKGLNLKSLEIIINCTGNASSIKTIQSLGRVLRVKEGKKQPIFYDFNDDMPFFVEHTKERILAFQEEGHTVKYSNL